MRFTITSQGSDRPLELDIFGYHMEVSGMDTGSISVSDSNGRLAVRYVEPQTIPTVDDISQNEISQVIESNQSGSASQAEVIEAEHSANTSEISETAAIHSLDGTEQLDQLFTHLVVLRKQIAAEVNLPPYIIFHDSTLRDMCRLLPSDLEKLRAVQGVGQAKLEKYGLRFIQGIHEFVSHVKEVA